MSAFSGKESALLDPLDGDDYVASETLSSEPASERTPPPPDASDINNATVDASNCGDAPSIHPAIVEDHAFIREFLPKAAILTLTKEFVTVVIIRTAYSRVQLRIQYTANYPEETPLVEITSATLPTPLLRNKEKECLEKAKEHLGHSQVQHIYEHIYRFIQTNMFIPCWKEMKQITTLCEGKGQLGADEKEGVLQLRLRQGEYRQNIKLKIPPMYPEEGVEIEFTSSNFPADMQYMFRNQAEEIVRRCMAGYSPEQALQGSNPIKLPDAKKGGESKIKLTAGSLKNLQHDVRVLKQISDLRVATSKKDEKFQYSVHANAERREARKDLRRLAKEESEADKEQERLMREQEQAEMKELMKQKVSETAQPSLLAAARFLVDDYACRLPLEKCQACKATVMPADPSDEALRNPQSSKRPMRTFCGHWLHWNCLNEWLTMPPFVRQCPICERQIWHPDWPEDYKQLEKAWQAKEARKREMSDVSDFMGVGAEFSTDAAKKGEFSLF